MIICDLDHSATDSPLVIVNLIILYRHTAMCVHLSSAPASRVESCQAPVVPGSSGRGYSTMQPATSVYRRPFDWILLGTIIILFASGFTLIDITVTTITPLSMTAGRMILGTCVLYVWLRALGHHLPPGGTQTVDSPNTGCTFSAWGWSAM